MKQLRLALLFIFSGYQGIGQVYWQQKVDTKIEVTLDDKKHMLRGYEEFTYTNNSPDTLRYIYIHLWPNAYKHDHTPYAEQKYRNHHTEFYYAKPFERGYIDSIQFSIDGNDVDYFYGENTPDIGRINLPHPLAPGKSMVVATPFKVKIPKVFSRLGHSGQSYYISQWFPKPAVYDRKGWHPLSYLDQGEFYSEIGSYDVKITLPKNYVVMATGNLQNEIEQMWLDSLAKADLPKDTLYNRLRPRSSEEIKTLHFKEDNIHDFAWFADKRWIVRKDTVYNPGTQDIVATWSAFLPAYQKQWLKATQHLQNTVRHYGKWIGPYPYKTIKAVQGDLKAGGGMEYPTVTIIDRDAGNATTLIHEAGHNWFYGILASNERDHSWMDEGMNTFYEQKTNDIIKHDRDTTNTSKKVGKGNVTVNVGMNSVFYQLGAAHMDQSINETSNNYTEINYGMNTYYKAAAMMGWLEEYMGKEAFEEGMHDYYNTWKHRHPYPEDFRKVMQKHTSKPLDWFFDNALATNQLVNFSIADVNTGKDGVKIKVKNKTGLSFPVTVNAYKDDSVIATGHALPFNDETVISLPSGAGNWDKIKLSENIPDGRTQNNTYKRSGVHKGGITLAGFAGTNLGTKQKIFIAPALGYNLYDGIEAGLLIHNLTWPESRFKYAIAPLYGFRSKSFVGAASASFSWYPKTTFQEIFLQADAKSFNFQETHVNVDEPLFARYVKLAPSLNFKLKETVRTSPVTRTVTLKGYAITEEFFDFNQDPVDSLYKPTIEQQQKSYGVVRYNHRNRRAFNPFGYQFEGQFGEDFVKLSLEGNIKINYHVKNRAFYIRGYAGKFISFNDANSDRYLLNAVYNGVNDYLYDETYLGRSEREGFGIRQVSMKEGGLKVPTPLYASPLGRSDNWLAAINIKTDLPLKGLPIRFFLDLATFADADKLNPSGNKILYDGGVEVYLFDVLNVYVPLFMSKDFNDYRKSISGKDGILDGIVFSLNLQNINWLKAPTGVFRLAGY
jgi:hypothetical protein